MQKSKRIIILFFTLIIIFIVFPSKITIQLNLDKIPEDGSEIQICGDDIAGNRLFWEKSSYVYDGRTYIITDINNAIKASNYSIIFSNANMDENSNSRIYGIKSISVGTNKHILCNLGVEDITNYSCNLFGGEIESNKGILFFKATQEYSYMSILEMGQIIRNTVLAYIVSYILLSLFVLLIIAQYSEKIYLEVIDDFGEYKFKLKFLLSVLGRYFRGTFVGVIFAIIINKLNTYLQLNIIISEEELLFLFAACGVTVTFLKKRVLKKIPLISITCMVGICLFFSICKLTNYLTVDEPRAISEQLYLQSDLLRHWFMTESRTNYLFMGTFWTFFPASFTSHLSISEVQLSKLVFWFWAFLIIQVIVYFLYEKILKEILGIKCNTLAVLGSYVTVLTIPLCNMAMKNYTYDMFSMLFGILGIEILIYFFVSNSKISSNYGIIAIIVLTLSVQEKILIAPVLLIAHFGFAYKNASNRWSKFWKYYACGILVSEAVLGFTNWWVLDVLRMGNYPILSIPEQYGGAFLCAYKVISLFGTANQQAKRLIILIIMLLTAFIGKIVIRRVTKHQKRRKIYSVLLKIIIILWLIWGILANFLQISISSNEYLDFILKYPSYIVTAIPTVSLISVICGMIYGIHTNKFDTLALVIGYCTIVNTFLYASEAGGYTWIKYSNIYVGCICICGFIILISWIYSLTIKCGNKLAIGISLALAVCTISETVWSMPAYVYFSPYWNVSVYYTEPLNHGWGEYISVAGEKIEEYCIDNNIDAEGGTIYFGYHGYWNNNTKFELRGINAIYEENGENLSNNDFVLVDNIVLQNEILDKGKLTKLEPVSVIKYRGIIMVRIYRGDQIKQILT